MVGGGRCGDVEEGVSMAGVFGKGDSRGRCPSGVKAVVAGGVFSCDGRGSGSIGERDR